MDQFGGRRGERERGTVNVLFVKLHQTSGVILGLFEMALSVVDRNICNITQDLSSSGWVWGMTVAAEKTVTMAGSFV